MLGPGGHVAQTGEAPMTGARLGKTLRAVWLTGQCWGTGPSVGTGVTGVAVTVTSLVGCCVLVCAVLWLPDVAQLASTRKHATSNQVDLCLGIVSCSLHLSYMLAEIGTALQR